MHILLVCTSGVSTTLLVQKMQSVAKLKNLDLHIWNCNCVESDDELQKADVILLGPQLRFALDKIQEKAKDKVVRVIDMMTYGRMDGEKAIELAISAYQDKCTKR